MSALPSGIKISFSPLSAVKKFSEFPAAETVIFAPSSAVVSDASCTRKITPACAGKIKNETRKTAAIIMRMRISSIIGKLGMFLDSIASTMG